jgi:HSP20 family molecular chaperone IbpA
MIKDMSFFKYMCGDETYPRSSWAESLAHCEAMSKQTKVKMDYDLVDLGEFYNLEVDMPNIEINSLKIFGTIKNEKTTLNITGSYLHQQKNYPPGGINMKYSPIHIGRRIGNIEDSIDIPGIVDLMRINADYIDGVVKMRLHKSSEHHVMVNVSHH